LQNQIIVTAAISGGVSSPHPAKCYQYYKLQVWRSLLKEEILTYVFMKQIKLVFLA